MILIPILVLSSAYPIVSFAQSDTLVPYPVKNLIYPAVSVRVLEKPGGYAFKYTVGNRHGALQSIHEFMVELKAPVKLSSAPEDWTLWDMDYDTIQVAIWFSSDSVADIDAGEVIGGYSLETGGLPRISRCWLSALEIVQGKEGQYDPATASIFTTSLQRTTIAPANPPSPLFPLIFLDTLLSFTHQSADLGWLGKGRNNDCDDDERADEGIAKNIELRLQKAKRELTKGDSVQTRKELEKLVQKVERVWKRSQEEEKKHKRDRWEKRDNLIMTSEAYALLKHNTECLIDRLPEKSKHGRGDDKDKKPKK
jgi:hypothetical protein